MTSYITFKCGEYALLSWTMSTRVVPSRRHGFHRALPGIGSVRQPCKKQDAGS